MAKPKLLKPQVSLIKEQKDAKKGMLDNPVSFLFGRAGTSKTFVAVATALDLLHKKQVESIIISRPTVESGESVGFLPGDLGVREGKLAPYLSPVLSAFEKVLGSGGKQVVDQMIENGIIRVIPPQFLRGHNFENSVTIIDESQNLTDSQLSLVLSRLCNGSKLILTVDNKQIDLVPEDLSCVWKLERIRGVEGVYFGELTHNHRHKLAIQLIDILEATEQDAINYLSNKQDVEK